MPDLPWGRWARIAALVVGGLFVAYLLVANIILRTGLLRGWLSEDEQKLRVEYTSAWSLYPGHVAARGLSVRYQDSNIQLHIGMDKARLLLDLWALTDRTLRVRRLDAEGATFRMRHKIETLEGVEGRVSAFPPIAGFADPPLEKVVPKPPIPDEEYDLWTIELADIAATVREVWTMEYRYRGEAWVTGGFHLRPRRELWIMPSVMITEGGELSLGDRDLIRGGKSRVEASMEPFDVRVPKGIEVLRHLNASVRQTGDLASLAGVSKTYFPGSPLALDRGAGPVSIEVRLEHGVFQPGSRVTHTSNDVIFDAGPVRIQGELAVIAHVEGPPDHPMLAVDLASATANMSPGAAPPGKGPPLVLRDVKASVTLDTADLVADARIARASGAIPNAHIADLRAWQALAPDKGSFDGGGATIAATASYDRGLLEGRLDVALEEARMTFGTFKVASSGKVWSGVASADPAKVIRFPGAGADLTGIALRLGRGHAEGLWLRARARELAVSTHEPVGADADIGVESGPGDRTMELFTRLAHLPDLAAEITSGTQLEATLHLRVRPHDVSLDVLDAKNGALEGRGRIRKLPGGLRGAFLVSVGPFRSGLELRDGDVSVRPLVGREWLDERLPR